ncbi:MAG: alkaline phosphatase family protein [Pyrinomonadaceae bacterium]
MPTKKSQRATTSKKRVRKKATRAGRSKASASRTAVKGTKKLLAAAAPKLVALAANTALDNLNKIEHIVVLMLENRSFDHMLGYLTLENGRTDVDGLTAGMANSLGNQSFPVHQLTKPAFNQGQDPCHSGACVDEQLSNNNGGFVSNYHNAHPNDPAVDLAMGYYSGSMLKVYDHLARHFLICDRWFCPVPGSTWPNRLYAVAGRAADSRDNRQPPLYNLTSFVRHLDARNVKWRWYAHDIATLRAVDLQFRLPLSFVRKNVAYFDQRSTFGGNSFLEDARAGKLAPVSWIDPNFVDLNFIGPSGSNDDHPPSDVRDGQELVLKVYNALINSPQWPTTLLIVTYDEHGGFFDHVAPPPANDDSPAFGRYGPRVPTFIVSPWVEAGQVSHTVFDHTSIIKTILARFCRQAGGQVPDMGARVNAAEHLGGLLTRQTPRPAPPPAALDHLIAHIAQFKSAVFTMKMAAQSKDAVAHPRELNELQQGIQKAKAALRKRGLPKGQP